MRSEIYLFRDHVDAGYTRQISLPDVSFTVVWCPPGRFRMGKPDSGVLHTHHPVRLTKGFWMSQTPVTRRQWRFIMQQELRPFGLKGQTGDQLPAVIFKWVFAKFFCDRLTKILRANSILTEAQHISLPTDAQWEYACRAGTETDWYFGHDESMLVNHAWYKINSDNRLHVVGQKEPNNWNIHDLYGSVAEWCLDGVRVYDEREVTDPLKVDPLPFLKITRGGSFEDSAKYCNSYDRAPWDMSNPYREVMGVRFVILDAPQIPMFELAST